MASYLFSFLLFRFQIMTCFQMLKMANFGKNINMSISIFISHISTHTNYVFKLFFFKSKSMSEKIAPGIREISKPNPSYRNPVFAGNFVCLCLFTYSFDLPTLLLVSLCLFPFLFPSSAFQHVSCQVHGPWQCAYRIDVLLLSPFLQLLTDFLI